MISLLVTGLFREPDLFTRLIDDWCQADGAISEIVIASWPDQRAHFDAHLKRFPSLPPVRFADSLPPQFDFNQPQNIMHQRQTLLNGLLACSHTVVLKIRTDFYVPASMFSTMNDAIQAPSNGPTKSFESKIWVPWIDYEEPFHIADEAMFGKRHDLLRLCSRDLSDLSEFGFPLANAHTILFKAPYEVGGRIFRDWLRAQKVTGVMLNDPTPSKFKKIEALLDVDVFQKLIALYHRYLFDNFVAESPPGALIFRPTSGVLGAYYADRQLDAAFEPRPFSREFAGFHNHFYAWTQASFLRLIEVLRSDHRRSPYAQAFNDPASVESIRDNALFDQFVAALAQFA